MKGAIVINGYYSSRAMLYQIARFQEEFELANVKIDIIKNNTAQDVATSYKIYDFILYLDKDCNFAKHLEQSGNKLINSGNTLALCDNKISTIIALRDIKGLQIPKSIFAPLRYDDYIDDDFLKQVETALGYPLIIKEARGSLGSQVYMSNNRDETISIIKKIGQKEYFFSKYMHNSKGRSIRAIVIGGEIVTAFKLTNADDFRSNAELGGIAELILLNDDFKDICLQIAKKLSLVYGGIDFFDIDTPTLCEVNSNAYFTTAEKVSSTNIAASLVQYIVKNINE